MSSQAKKIIQRTRSRRSILSRRTSLDPSAEVAEPYLLLAENSFPLTSSIPKDDDPKRIDAVIAGIHADMLKRTDEQAPVEPPAMVDEIRPTQHLSKRYTRPSHVKFRLPRDASTERKRSVEQTHEASDSLGVLSDMGRTTLLTEDLDKMLVEDEYIPGGFAGLDPELEKELLNDYADDFDSSEKRRSRHISSLHSSDPMIAVVRSPIELWQRARLLVAVYLYQNENIRPPILGQTTETTPMVDSQRSLTGIEESHRERKPLQRKDRNLNQTIVCGLIILQQISLDTAEEYRCVDYYDIGQGYFLMCNIADVSSEDTSIKPRVRTEVNLPSRRLLIEQEKNRTYQPLLDLKIGALSNPKGSLLAYLVPRRVSNEIQSVRLNCPFQVHHMICIPVYRLILAAMNTNKQSSWLILFGDASRKGMFLSKQEISGHVFSLLYVHEATILVIGCLGRVLLYNTRPLQFTSQPTLTSELAGLPFQSMEPIVHLCQISTYRSIGVLSDRCFVQWQYAPDATIRSTFCNPSSHEFTRCIHNARFDLIIFAFADGSILVYHLPSMKQIRRYHEHWKPVTGLVQSKDQLYFLSSSMDHRINVWNLETMQHLYQYRSESEIQQLDVIDENLFYYRTLNQIKLFKLNLPTMLFSIVKDQMRSIRIVTDAQRTTRIVALMENSSSVLLSPVSGSSLTSASNISKKPIKQILHDISRSSIYALQFDGEIVLYRTHNIPCVAEYKIQSKSEQKTVTCMTLVNPMRTHLVGMNAVSPSIEKSLDKQLIFFGHVNGYITLFHGDSLMMEPVLAHPNAILCLGTSRISTEKSNIVFTNYEMILSASQDNQIHVWDLTMDANSESIQLVHLLTVVQEKNISSRPIEFLLMSDNFLVANYSDQLHLHLWQLIDISIRTTDAQQWGIVEHPTKGSHHRRRVQAITSASQLKLFASSDIDGTIKLWDKTNSLLREISLDRTLGAIEFLTSNGELLVAYQNNIHLILPADYLVPETKFSVKQPLVVDRLAEDNLMQVTQPLTIPYPLLPVFNYTLKKHHAKKRLERFERQLAGRFAMIESDSSQSNEDTSPPTDSDRLSVVSDDLAWSGLADDVKDILRMKKYSKRQENRESTKKKI